MELFEFRNLQHKIAYINDEIDNEIFSTPGEPPEIKRLLIEISSNLYDVTLNIYKIIELKQTG